MTYTPPTIYVMTKNPDRYDALSRSLINAGRNVIISESIPVLDDKNTGFQRSGLLSGLELVLFDNTTSDLGSVEAIRGRSKGESKDGKAVTAISPLYSQGVVFIGSRTEYETMMQSPEISSRSMRRTYFAENTGLSGQSKLRKIIEASDIAYHMQHENIYMKIQHNGETVVEFYKIDKENITQESIPERSLGVLVFKGNKYEYVGAETEVLGNRLIKLLGADNVFSHVNEDYELRGIYDIIGYASHTVKTEASNTMRNKSIDLNADQLERRQKKRDAIVGDMERRQKINPHYQGLKPETVERIVAAVN